MLRKGVRAQAYFFKARPSTLATPLTHSETFLGAIPSTREAFELTRLSLHDPNQTSSSVFPYNLPNYQNYPFKNIAQTFTNVDPYSSSSKIQTKNYQVNPLTNCQDCLCSSFCSPLFPFLTHQSSRSYSTSKETSQDQTKFSQEEVDEMIEILSNGEKVRGLFDNEGNLTLESRLAQRLFQEGVDLSELSLSDFQIRFQMALNEKSKLVFYPTEVTSDIFRIVLQEERGPKIYLTSQKGIGKSFSIALLTYLIRMSPNYRVLYINNPENFLGDWHSVQNEFQTAFREELKDPELQEKLSYFFATESETPRPGPFLQALYSVLRKKNIRLFLIIDQVNLLDNLEKATSSPNRILAYNLYTTLRYLNYSYTTRVLVSSATNEMITLKNDQEFPEVTLYPKYPSEGLAKRLIASKFKVSAEDEFVQRVYKMSFGYFLLIHELSKKINKERLEESIMSFEYEKTLEIQRDLLTFISSGDSNRRKKAMMTVYQALTKNPNFPDKQERNIPRGQYLKDSIDRRYIIYRIGEGSVSVLHPFVMKALGSLFTDVQFVSDTFFTRIPP